MNNMELSVSNGVLRYTGGKEIEIIINNIVSKVYNDKKEKVILFMTDGTWTEFDLADITSPTFTLFSDLITWFEDNVIPEIGGGAAVYTQNVAYLNAENDDSDNRIFDTYAAAAVWISANGSPSASNQWTVLSAGNLDEDVELVEFINLQGYAGSIIKSVTSTVAFTGLNIFDGKIENCQIVDLFVAEGKQYYIENCIVQNIEPVPTDGNGCVNMQNSTFLGGDFSNTTWIIPPENNKYLAIYSDITGFQSDGVPIRSSAFGDDDSRITSIPSAMHNCTMIIASTSETKDIHFQNCAISIDTLTTSGNIRATNSKLNIDELNISSSNTDFYFCEIMGNKNLTGSGTHNFNHCNLNYGDLVVNDTARVLFRGGSYVEGKTEFNDTSALVMYQDAEIEDLNVNDSATVDDRRNVVSQKDGRAASPDNKGQMRYREDANNSYLEQVMKTGASTYAWVVVKTNTW